MCARSPEVHPWIPIWVPSGSLEDIVSGLVWDQAGAGYRNNLNSHSDLTRNHSRVWRTSVKLLVKHFHFYSCSFLYSLGHGRFNPKDLFFSLSLCLLLSSFPGLNKSATLGLSWGPLSPRWRQVSISGGIFGCHNSGKCNWHLVGRC